MNVVTVTANVRFSKALVDGSHKTVELGAEAAVGKGEAWQEAQAALYAALGTQIKALWGNGTSKAQETPTPPVALPAPAQAPDHYCQEHGSAYKRYEKEGKSWYAHKGPDGKWCREG